MGVLSADRRVATVDFPYEAGIRNVGDGLRERVPDNEEFERS